MVKISEYKKIKLVKVIKVMKTTIVLKLKRMIMWIN